MFVDECQNFLTPSVETVLTESRKYGLHLTMAQQFYGQGMDRDLLAAVMGNTAIKIAGRNDTMTLKKMDERMAVGLEALLLADALMVDPSEIPFPKSAVPIRTHFFHRLHCVDCEITVRQWAEANRNTVDFYYSYFDVTGANRGKAKPPRRSRTKIDLEDGSGIIPDAVFQLRGENGVRRLFVMEVFNQARTKRMHDKLAEYRYAIGEEAINRQFGYPHAPRILAIFEDDKSLQLTWQRMAEIGKFSANFAPYFFLKTLEGMSDDFRNGWLKPTSSRPSSLF